MLQELACHACLSYAKYKKALVLKGERNIGKSQVVFVLTELAGLDQACQLSVEFMDDPEKRSVIKGTTLNSMSEPAVIDGGAVKTLVCTEEMNLISSGAAAAPLNASCSCRTATLSPSTTRNVSTGIGTHSIPLPPSIAE